MGMVILMSDYILLVRDALPHGTYFIKALIAQQFKLSLPDEKDQAVAVGRIFPQRTPLSAPCAVEPLVATKTLNSAAVSEVLAGTAVQGVA